MRFERDSYDRARHMMYTQRLKDLPTKTIDNLIDAIEKTKPKKYALIIHNDDVTEWGEPVEEHVHVMISYPNPRTLDVIARRLKDEPQSVVKWEGTAEEGFCYLIRSPINSICKYWYSHTKIIANFDYLEELIRLAKRNQKISEHFFINDIFFERKVTRKEIEIENKKGGAML